MTLSSALQKLLLSIRANSAPVGNVFEHVDQFCNIYAASTEAERASVELLLGDIRPALLAYTWHTAQEAVRRGSTECIRRGLISVVVEGGRVDLRDNIVRLAVLFDAAQRLQVDGDSLSREIASLTTNPLLKHEIERFGSRLHRERRLDAFLIRAVGQGPSFAYESYALNSRRRWFEIWK